MKFVTKSENPKKYQDIRTWQQHSLHDSEGEVLLTNDPKTNIHGAHLWSRYIDMWPHLRRNWKQT